MTSGTVVACCQLSPSVGDPGGNLEQMTEAIAAAAASGARIVVLPELVSSGYAFADGVEARRYAEPVDGPAVRAMLEAGREAGATIVGGLCEAGADGRTYNSAVVVDDGAVVSVYRKLHLWDRERECFAPGASRPPVVRTRHGRIGVGVCYDLEFPEVSRGLALDGAQLLAFPTNWPLESRSAGERPMLATLAMATARLNRVFVAVCDRAGAERGVEYDGSSVIARPDGRAAAQADPARRREVLLATCDLAVADDKRLGATNDVFGDRRPEFYGSGA